MNSTLTYWLRLHFANVSALKIQSLLKRYGSAETIVHANQHSLQASGLSKEVITKIHSPHHAQIKQALQWAEQTDRHIITLEDPLYPQRLKQIADPPLLLYIWGNPEVLAKPSLALVGSRNPTPDGLEQASHFATALCLHQLIITSGLAIGIDAESHRGALQAGGETVAVLGSGLNRLYPRKHQALAESIAKQGAVISEFPLETPPLRNHFPRRNRIISGLSLGVLVVQAALKSGSLITAQLAAEQNREVFAIPSSPNNPLSRGNHWLIKQGAKLTEDVDDILQDIGFITEVISRETPASSAKTKPVSQKLDQPTLMLLDCLGFELTSINQLVSRTGLTAGEVSALLLNLQLRGYIKRVPGGVIRANHDEV